MNADFAAFIQYLLLFGMGSFIGWWVNKFNGRRVFNKHLLGFIAMLPLLALHVYWYSQLSGRASQLSDFKQAEFTGMYFGPAFWASVLGAVFFHRDSRKARNPEGPADENSESA